jgi:hypothetical protein
MSVEFSDKAGWLGDFFLNYKDESLDNLADFFSYNDIGLPLAFCIAEGIVQATPAAEEYVNETWNILLQAIGLTEADLEIEGINEMKIDFIFDMAKRKQEGDTEI